jgi:hypothetical protein
LDYDTVVDEGGNDHGRPFHLIPVILKWKLLGQIFNVNHVYGAAGVIPPGDNRITGAEINCNGHRTLLLPADHGLGYNGFPKAIPS